MVGHARRSYAETTPPISGTSMSSSNRPPLHWMLVASIYVLWAASIYVLWAASGITQTLSVPPSGLLWLQAVLVASAASTWCTIDAAHRGKPLVRVLQMLLFFTWPIGVPVYLLMRESGRGCSSPATTLLDCCLSIKQPSLRHLRCTVGGYISYSN